MSEFQWVQMAHAILLATNAICAYLLHSIRSEARKRK